MTLISTKTQNLGGTFRPGGLPGTPNPGLPGGQCRAFCRRPTELSQERMLQRQITRPPNQVGVRIRRQNLRIANSAAPELESETHIPAGCAASSCSRTRSLGALEALMEHHCRRQSLCDRNPRVEGRASNFPCWGKQKARVEESGGCRGGGLGGVAHRRQIAAR